MSRYVLLIFVLLSLLMASCKDKNAVTLKEKLQSEYVQFDKVAHLSSGSKVQYMQMEKSINRQYIKDLDSLINTAFARQLERFKDEELGVLSSYKNMFSWLFKSKQSWDDAMIVMSNKYFNSLDVSQEQHALYLEYVKNIKEIRSSFFQTKDYHHTLKLIYHQKQLLLIHSLIIPGTIWLLSLELNYLDGSLDLY